MFTKKVECLIVALLMFLFVFVGLSGAYADNTLDDEAFMQKANVGNLGMYLTRMYKESLVEKMASEDSENQLTILSNWLGKPVELAFSIANGTVRSRLEKDFIVTWYHSQVSLVDGKKTSLDVVRDAVNEVMGQAYFIGADETLSIKGTDTFKSPKAELSASVPREIPGTKAIIFGYSSASDSKRDWGVFVRAVYVLVEDKDAIIVMEKLLPMTAGTKNLYYGLVAGKVRLDRSRLTEEELEQAKNGPVLARNVIFDEATDTNDIPDQLLNGCMWPIEDKAAVGARDAGPGNNERFRKRLAERLNYMERMRQRALERESQADAPSSD